MPAPIGFARLRPRGKTLQALVIALWWCLAVVFLTAFGSACGVFARDAVRQTFHVEHRRQAPERRA